MFGIIYRWNTRKLKKEERVGILAFSPLTFLMPVTYAMLTPLALFTLDTANWETRNHEETIPEPLHAPELVREVTATDHVMDTGDRVPARPAVARSRSHAQLPAA